MSVCFSGCLPAYSCIQLLYYLYLFYVVLENKILSVFMCFLNIYLLPVMANKDVYIVG